MQHYCSYYQAHVKRSHCWFLVAVLRSFEHVAFDRTIDKENSIFEFFVPIDTEKYFLDVMEYFQKNNIVSQLTQHKNRLK